MSTFICPHCNHSVGVQKTLSGKLAFGIVGWWYGTNLLTQTMLYEGERAQDTKERARLMLEMLDREALTYLHLATPKVYPFAA